MDSVVRHRLFRRRRRHQPLPRCADRIPDAAGAAVILGIDPQTCEGVRDVRARARGRHARRLHRARPVSVLRVLGRDARADVLPHRHLGLRQPCLRGHQVHALHDGRQRADARRHPGAGLLPRRCGRDGIAQLRPPEALRAGNPARAPVLGLPGIRGCLCHQSAGISVSHVAARRARAGADSRVGDSGRRPAEDGHVWSGEVRVSALSGGSAVLRAVSRCRRGDRHHLRRARGDGAARSEEARRVFQREPSRVRGARHFGDEHPGGAGGDLPDAGARRQHRRALPHRRHAFRSASHALDRGVRRTQEGAPEIVVGLPRGDAGVDWIAWPERVRRRAADSRRRVPVGSASCVICRHRRALVGRVHAVDVPARELRTGHQRRERDAARPDDARTLYVVAGRGDDDCDGGLPDGLSEADGAGGRAACGTGTTE